MCRNHQRYTEDRELGVAYLDVFPCNDAAAVRTEEVAPGVLIDVRTDTDEVAGIELLDLDTPLAKWLASAAASLSLTALPTISHGTAANFQQSYITSN
jgi:hypothetical protein